MEHKLPKKPSAARKLTQIELEDQGLGLASKSGIAIQAHACIFRHKFRPDFARLRFDLPRFVAELCQHGVRCVLIGKSSRPAGWYNRYCPLQCQPQHSSRLPFHSHGIYSLHQSWCSPGINLIQGMTSCAKCMPSVASHLPPPK